MKFLKHIISMFFSSERRAQAIVKKYLRNAKKITLSIDGFEVVALDNAHDPWIIKWDEVHDVKHIGLGLAVITERTTVEINKDWTGWHLFLRNIPRGYNGFNYDLTEQYFNSLLGCEVCGLMAVLNEKCQACGAHVWDEGMQEEYSSKEEYLREEQLTLFEPDEEGEKADINNESEGGFLSYKDWKPLVSEEDFA